jgi:LysR family transcriptional regulator, glycine cleavage system transcriptional activator
MQLPNLQTIKAFDSAARHQSFSRAAADLGLTPGAVSHHMKNLEERLRVKLFKRNGRGIALTEAGQSLHMKVKQGLALVEQAFDDAHHRKLFRTLTVSTLPSFAERWLIPRLGQYLKTHRQIDLSLRTSLDLVDLAKDGVDVAIRYGTGDWDGVERTKLKDEILFPVCSPNFLNAKHPQTLKDMAKSQLLRHGRQPWTPWFQAAGLDALEPSRGLNFNDSGAMLNAAAHGYGIALARFTLVEDDLRSGRLVKLFDVEVQDVYSWYAVWRPSADKKSDVAAFCTWLQQQLNGSAKQVNN